jgi:hypothetical protein
MAVEEEAAVGRVEFRQRQSIFSKEVVVVVVLIILERVARVTSILRHQVVGYLRA